MNTVAKATCVACDLIKPRPEMKQRTFSVKSGSSTGISAGRKGKNARLSVREYHKKKKVWICHDCWGVRPRWISAIFMATLFGPIYVPFLKGWGGIGKLFYIITFGLFLMGWLFYALQALTGQLTNHRGLPNTRIF
jgi:hypothetical protein